MHVVQPKAPVVGRVVSSEPCLSGRSAAFVRHISIDVSGTPLAGAFRAGQTFGVLAPGEDERGRRHTVRLYSLACPSWGEDGGGAVLSTTVKRLIDEYEPGTRDEDQEEHSLFLGICSNYLCDRKPGDEVLVTGPAGRHFLLPEDPSEHDYLFIATGTGIAPFYGMVRELLERADGPVDRRIHLIAGAPYTTELIYDPFFAELEQTHSNFHYHRVISRSDVRGEYVDHYLERTFDSSGFRSLLEGDRTLIYMCGVMGMQFGVYRTLARHGLSRGYMDIREPLALDDHEQWQDADIKRGVRPGPRCLVEVY